MKPPQTARSTSIEQSDQQPRSADHSTLGQDTATFRQGVVDCIPTLLGYLSIGFAAGVVARTSGLSLIEIALMSTLVYAGSAQFIAAGMLAAGLAGPVIVLTIFLTNLRHLLLSAAVSPFFRHLTPLRNLAVGSLLTDETFGVTVQHGNGREDIGFRWVMGVNLTAWVNWILATVVGGVLGAAVAQPEKLGLDFALPAMFIGLLLIQMNLNKKLKRDLLVLAGAMVTVVLVNLLADGNISILAATVVASTIGMGVDRDAA